MSRRYITLLAPAAAALVAAPAGASAAQIAADHPCYADPAQRADTVGLSGSGFTPNAPYTLTIDGVPATGGKADANGAVAQTLAVPSLTTVGKGTLHHVFTVAAQDGATSATTPLAVSRLFATFKPGSGDPKSLKVRFSLYGFSLAGAQDPQVYVHYVRPSGKLAHTYRLGRAHGPCGSLRTSRRRLFPFSAGRGAWKLQFDTSRRYVRGTSSSPFLFYTLGVTVRSSGA